MASGGMRGVDVRYIEPGTPEYAQAKEVRYRELYSDLGLPRSLVEDTDGRTYLHLAAFKKGQVVGYARLHLERGESKVFQVCVDRRHQGRGIARALMLELIDSRPQRGSDRDHARRPRARHRPVRGARVRTDRRSGFSRHAPTRRTSSCDFRLRSVRPAPHTLWHCRLG